MPKYYSPAGNAEEWATKPDGYFTPDEWIEAHPPVIEPKEPTKEQRIAELTAEYTREKANLCEAYTTASMKGDSETAASVVADMTDLDAWFDEEYERIINETEAK